jgi:transposase InsO family protein
MSKARVIVLAVVHQGLTKSEAAELYGVSWQWVHTLVGRYNEGGLDALEPRSRRPASNSKATPPKVADRVVELRKQLDTDGLDAGPVTIASHLAAEGVRPPSTSTIRRILHAAGLVVANPKKRPRSSLHRFSADQPNECWQSDFTHWRLADGTDTEILNWLDDHARYLLLITAFARVTGENVVETFTSNVNNYGPPASTLTDNGSVYTSRFTGGRNAFEYLLHLLGIQQKNGRVNHPQTQGKIERFHQTLRNGSRSNRRPRSWTSCRHSSIASSRSTTRSGRTAPSTASPPTRPTWPPRKPSHAAPRPQTTSGSASTTSTTTARSPYAEPAGCTTSASVPVTAAPPS